MAELRGHGVRVAESVVENRLFDDHHETVALLVDDSGAPETRRRSFLRVVGYAEQSGVGAQQRTGVASVCNNPGTTTGEYTRSTSVDRYSST